MASTTHRWRKRLLLGVALAAGPVGSAWAQARAGDGMLGEYYEGTAFERLVTRRYDATLAFDWGHGPPVPGLGAEYFSVRWTGWLVPPVSGRYVLHATVDDGMRIWVNDKLILNEWRPQPVRHFTTSIELKAGEPYKLRVDYFQDILDTSARITWERPDVPLAPPPASWRNLWGLTAEMPKPEPIPTQFLFSRNPLPPVVTPVVARRPPPTKPLGRVYLAPVVVTTRAVAPTAKARRPVAAQRPVVALAAATPVVVVTPASDSATTGRVERLAVGETVTMPELYFTQGQARLLPPARVALDALAAGLRTRPELRLEVQGHTDNVGNAELNRQLSQQRAEAVCLYLWAHGVGTAQLRAMGYGGTQPVADNADPAQRPRNRRVVLRRL
jgi:outer membrane protein OmpA-like peptidoglycan-associated protein